jgi:hypothetical protein
MNEQIRRKVEVAKEPAATASFDFVAHPLAGKFPMIEGSAFENLKADIKRQGILEPIRLYQGMVLDGRNRYAAAKAVGHVFTPADFREFIGNEKEAEDWVISTNFHRRQLTNAQKQEIIQNEIRKHPELKDREIARNLNVSHSTVGAARERMAKTPEAKRFDDLRRLWDKLETDQLIAFVKEKAADIQFAHSQVLEEASSKSTS